MKYSLTPQERPNYCVCSVLQAILRKQAIDVSQREIAAHLSPSEKGFKVQDEKLRSFLESHGFAYTFYWQDQTPFNEREAVLEDMDVNHGFLGIDAHVYLLDSFYYPMLKMVNPEDASPVKKDLSEIVKEMEKTEGFFAVIKKCR